MRVAKTAGDADAFRAPVLCYESARAGLLDLLTTGSLPRTGRVLLPSYIGLSEYEGSGVLDPAIESGRDVGFYRLNSDLSIDAEDLARQFGASGVGVVIVIHYFGRTVDGLDEVQDLADQHGVVLVEDLAHGLFTALGDGPAGTRGDASLFSIHKMLPIHDGGAVRYRTPDLIGGQRSTRPDLHAELLSYDLRAIAARRRENAAAILGLLARHPLRGIRFDLLWPDIQPHDVPQTLPVRVMGGGRDDVYAAMNAAGWGMVSLYHTLIPQLRDSYPEMLDLSLSITNFPVHQDLDPGDCAEMVETFAQCLTESDYA